ncbi:MAG: enoyl-CoA hydratase/isomerase family protein [bacterium]|nr:enoyl-CoA hydratase/isomerase family protein [bacterium]
MEVLYNVEDGIGRITLSNPPHNTLTHPVFAGRAQMKAFLDDPSLRAVVVRGAGRHFCAGADLECLGDQLADPDAIHAALDEGKRLLDLFRYATVPVIAAVRGSCLGAGLELALACHFRVASAHALIGLPETGHGAMPGFGGTLLAQDTIPRAGVMSLVLSGREFGAEEALGLGLVDRVVATKDLDTEVERFIDALVDNRPPSLVRAVMESIHNADRMPREEALQRETALFMEVAREGFQPDTP